MAEVTGPGLTAAFEVNGKSPAKRRSASRVAFQEHVKAQTSRPTAPLPVQTIPVPGQGLARAHGNCVRKPWEYEVTAVIACLNSGDRIPLILELLRLQTVRPFIILIDTGSRPEEYRKLECLRAQDVEVHCVRLNGVQNTSEPVSMAMDVGLSLCRTRFLFSTHDDCFLRTRIGLQYWRDLASAFKVAGHGFTRRPQNDWEGMFGQTAVMFDADWLIDNGLSWNMRRGRRLFGISHTMPLEQYPVWPDTETGLNYLFRRAGIKPFITGPEKNWQRNKDAFIDHCRSASSAAIYDPRYFRDKASVWLEEAVKEGWERVKLWLTEELPEAPPLPWDEPAAVLPIPSFTQGQY